MYFLNTDMHVVTFAITVFELVMLFFQIIYFLERTSDKQRLLYLILLVFLILYNLCGGLFPDEQLPISITLQLMVEYFVGFTMYMYVAYYFYAAFDLKKLKYFATYGSFFFLFLPFLLLFVIPYLVTGNLDLSRRLTVVIPFGYGLFFMFFTTRAFRDKFKQAKERTGSYPYDLLVAAYISAVCWTILPLIVFIGDYQLLEHGVTNAGFLLMSIVYIKTTIYRSRDEYNKLQDLNADLQSKVIARTLELEKLVETGKNTFINLVHETKTPLTLINNYLADYIKNSEDPSEELKIVKSNVNRLTTDMVNFFDALSYEKGFAAYDNDQVADFSSILNDKIALFRSLAQKKEVIILSHIAANVHVKAHPSALERISNNLIENAIKYTPTGKGVFVSLETQTDIVVFTVSDEGKGIPTSLFEKVFDPFYKLSVSATGDFNGMGMGLAIVKKIVSEINGKITLKSEENAGTEFKVFLQKVSTLNGVPIARHVVSKDMNLPVSESELEDTVRDQDRPFILVVEDNNDLLAYLSGKLSDQYNVYIARDGAGAFEKIRQVNQLDLIICDIMMPGMDGFQLYHILSKSETFSHIPILFLTAKTDVEFKMQGLKMGAIDYIEKPFRIEELLLKVESILNAIRKHQTALIRQAYKTLLHHGNPETRNIQEVLRGYNLTDREIQVLKYVADGASHKAMAGKLNISVATVGKHVSNIFRKVSVTNKVELLNKLKILGNQSE